MADNQGILSVLECPVCMEYMMPPIYQCRNQHLICAHCQNQQELCPICRVKYKRERNLCMEKIAEHVFYPCKYEEHGCNARLRLYEKENHEQICVRNGQYNCVIPMPNKDSAYCDWTGPFEEADNHIRQKHSQLIHSIPDGSFNSKSSELMNFQYHILFDDNLFCILIHKEPLRTSSIQKIYTFFFHIISITCRQEKCYAYNVKIEGQDGSFEGIVGDIISHIDIKDMAVKSECLHFMGNDQTLVFEGNIVKI